MTPRSVLLNWIQWNYLHARARLKQDILSKPQRGWITCYITCYFLLFLCWTRHASNCFPAFHHLVQLGICPKPVWSPVLLQLLYPQFKACIQKKNICSGDISAACLQKTVSQSYRSLVQRVCCGTLKTSDKSRVAHGLFLKNCSLKLHSKIIFFSFFYLCARHYILGNLHKPGVGNSWPQGPVTCRF